MKVDFDKYQDGLAPAIIQDAETRNVLMLGFMNKEALEATEKSGRVTFFSRSKQRLWTKGEESGNFLDVKDVLIDCDQDTLLVRVRPEGPVCHKGSDTCWGEKNEPMAFLRKLENIIEQRQNSPENASSYVSSLFRAGINKIAQKVGEEAVETVIEAKDNNDERFIDESADLLFHLLILLQARGYRLKDVEDRLKKRHKA